MRAARATAMAMLIIPALWLAVLPSRLAAQVVVGRVVTEADSVPVPGARISLMNAADVRVDSTRTDAAGRFRLQAPAPGTYRLYMALEGYASQGTTSFELAAGQTLERDARYQLVSIGAMRTMGNAIANDSMLQENLPKICGEALRPWESGVLVGVIRDRRTSKPIPGAVVTVQPPATPDSTPAPRTTVSNRHGTYIFCNVPGGDDIMLRVRAPGRHVQEEKVQVHNGMIGWFDVYVRGP